MPTAPSRQKTRGRAILATAAKVLEAVELGFLVLEVRGRYRAAFIQEGTAGLRRMIEREERKALMDRLRKLKRRGHLVEREVGKRIVLALSRSGTISLLKRRIKSAPKRADGRKSLVSFDIPESQKPVRDRMRRLLRQLGFKMLHRSVWITDKDVAGPLRKIIEAEKGARWLRLFEVNETW